MVSGFFPPLEECEVGIADVDFEPLTKELHVKTDKIKLTSEPEGKMQHSNYPQRCP